MSDTLYRWCLTAGDYYNGHPANTPLDRREPSGWILETSNRFVLLNGQPTVPAPTSYPWAIGKWRMLTDAQFNASQAAAAGDMAAFQARIAVEEALAQAEQDQQAQAQALVDQLITNPAYVEAQKQWMREVLAETP